MGIISNFISEGEHQQQDFKLRIDSSKKIAVTLSAFANSYGGQLLVGVKDNGNIKGLKDPEEEFHMLKAAAEMHCKPQVELIPEVHKEDGKNVLLVKIPEAEEKPVFAENTDAKWRVYLRKMDENIMANSVIIKSMQLNADIKSNFEVSDTIIHFLKIAKSEPNFGFGYARKNLGGNNRKTELILASLIRWNLIEFHLNSSTISYSVKSKTKIPDAGHNFTLPTS